jgi:diguanylate cyclase (GGDEF)-like protein
MPRPLARYVTIVSAGGLLVIAALLVTDVELLRERLEIGVLLLVLGAVLTESAPIRVARHNFEEEITVSTALSFAILLWVGALWAVLAQAIASVTADVREGKPISRVLFNVGQYTLAISAAAAVLHLWHGPRYGEHPIVEGQLPLFALAAVVFFAVNSLLVTTAYSLSQGVGVRGQWLRDIGFNLGTTLGTLGLAPIILVCGAFSPFLLPVLALPLYALHRAGRQAIQSEHQALHDVLTGLPNRALLHDRVGQAITQAKRERGVVGLMLMDLNRFKEINDTLGHHHGDDLLQQIGPRLKAALREADTVARLGGDEFAVLLPGIDTPESAREVGEKLLAALDEPFTVDGMSLEVGASIGGAAYPVDGDDVDALLRRADVAMYVAKDAGAGVQMYSSSDDEHSPDRLALAADLRRAMDEEELFVAYQPKIELAGGTVQGVEALVRWQHPERGMIPPTDFIGHAEHTGLIKPLTLYVLDHALRQAAIWRAEGLRLSVAVNLSVRALLDHSLPDDVHRLLCRWSVPPELLELEITESTIMADPVRAREILDELHEMGIRLAIDDFGTGYSSLGYLKRLPVDEIKIDRSFISSMCEDAHDATIVRSTIELGRNLGLRVVAEGIETDEVCAQLQALGCHLGQGYAFSPPIPGPELTRWVRARQAELWAAAATPAPPSAVLAAAGSAERP